MQGRYTGDRADLGGRGGEGRRREAPPCERGVGESGCRGVTLGLGLGLGLGLKTSALKHKQAVKIH